MQNIEDFLSRSRAKLIPKFMAAGNEGGIVIVMLSNRVIRISENPVFDYFIIAGNNIMKPIRVMKQRTMRNCILSVKNLKVCGLGKMMDLIN